MDYFQISPNAFTGQSGMLEELKLMNMGLTKLPIFASLPKLVNFDVSDNHLLTDITEGAFANAPNIKQLRAENAKICSLSPCVYFVIYLLLDFIFPIFLATH
jgi:hypothetical protein